MYFYFFLSFVIHSSSTCQDFSEEIAFRKGALDLINKKKQILTFLLLLEHLELIIRIITLK